MAYRNIVIANKAHLSTKNEQLIIDVENGFEKKSVPIEDVNCIVIENRYATVSAYALSKLSEYGVTVLVCNNEHLPTGVLLPINNVSRQLKIVNLQFNQTKPTLNRLWQQIVKAKVCNQAKCLEYCGKDEIAGRLFVLSKNVQSGDKQNLEAQAAAIYFKSLFGKDFTRTQENSINAALNYGYSILRGNIARTLATYGFEPSLGIHHKSELNNFNLADDIIEPFRPVVDLFVATNMEPDDDFTSDIKHKLCSLLSVNIISGEENHSVSYAIERTVQSLNACYTNKRTQLILPELTELRLHQYE